MTHSAARSTDNVIYADFGARSAESHDPREWNQPVDWSEVTGQLTNEMDPPEAEGDATVLYLHPSKKTGY